MECNNLLSGNPSLLYKNPAKNVELDWKKLKHIPWIIFSATTPFWFKSKYGHSRNRSKHFYQ